MKITCTSCGSKYTIADAKVQGKKVKVRCKGCKESILVDGTAIGEGGSDDGSDDDAEEDAPVEVAPAAVKAPAANLAGKPAGKSNLWSVNINDDDSRDMTLDELVAAWKSGVVTSDAYVWKDGMGDWKPILEVGELKLKLGPPKKAPGVISSATGAKAAGKMDDLFGGTDDAAMPSESAGKAAAGGDGAKPTGARNDSSVLFSLDSLKGGAPDPSARKDRADDLFGGLGTGPGPVLGGSIDLLTAPAKEPPPAPAGVRGPAPVVQESKGKGALIGAIIGAAVIIGGAIVFFGGSSEEDSGADKGATAEGPSEAEKKAEEERKKMAEELQKMKDDLKAARDEALKAGKDPDKAEAEKKAEQDKEKTEQEAKAKEEAEKAAATTTSDKPATTSSGPKPAGAPAPAPAPSSGGAAFDVGAARAALEAAAANAAACGKPGGPTGSGKVQVTFASSGRVTSANVISGPFGGTAVGGCVASTFRRARVPAFSGDPKTVAKSFSIQ